MQCSVSTIQHMFTGLHFGLPQPSRASLSARPSRAGCVTPLAAVLNRKEANRKRHYRIRNKVSGSPERPRLAVHRSNNHIYAQVIDDLAGHTLASCNTLSKELFPDPETRNGGTKDAAEAVGKKIAEICLAKGIQKVCYDRGGHVYHGRVKALADGAREGGLDF
mmetsp:Transcript_4748/g.13659  ORF Transcript_4748/g.13659 Transcript_4748/m.13659 type:complete len:164 (-) Transcript_4748:575-1066(-)